jgi:DNA polymerase III epsilon subunit-like protein
MPDQLETYFSVDIETAGPTPSEYALLSIGACRVDDPDMSFYVELQPTSMAFTREALEISGLSLETLAREGLPPAEAMTNFEAWIHHVTDDGCRAVFVAFNAPFDWMFVNEYFYRVLGRNPFGHSALDIKAYFMGLCGSNWTGTQMVKIREALKLPGELSHQALEDAKEQAVLFRHMLAIANERSKGQNTERTQ